MLESFRGNPIVSYDAILPLLSGKNSIFISFQNFSRSTSRYGIVYGRTGLYLGVSSFNWIRNNTSQMSFVLSIESSLENLVGNFSTKCSRERLRRNYIVIRSLLLGERKANKVSQCSIGVVRDPHTSVVSYFQASSQFLCVEFSQIQCGHRFNVVSSHDGYTLMLWGSNDAGQLGNNNAPRAESFPIELLISDIPRSPKAYLRVSSISCGAKLVAACVQPSKGRVFVWGAFRVVDIPDSLHAGETKEIRSPSIMPQNPWLAKSKTPVSTSSFSTSRLYTQPQSKVEKRKSAFCEMRAICVPTAVTHELWTNLSLVKATCGHTSNVSVMPLLTSYQYRIVEKTHFALQVILENGEVYGFDMVQTIWFQREAKPAEAQQTAVVPIEPLRNTFGLKPTYGKAKVVSTIPSPRTENEKFRILPLKGSYHLKACVFQYRHIRLVFFQYSSPALGRPRRDCVFNFPASSYLQAINLSSQKFPHYIQQLWPPN